MADFSLTITIPDAKMAPLLEALRHQFGAKGDEAVPFTAAELKALYTARVVEDLRDLYRKHQVAKRDQAPLDTL